MDSPRGPQRTARAAQRARCDPLKRPMRRQPAREMTRDRGPRALALLQNRPRTSPELQLSPNAISPWLT